MKENSTKISKVVGIVVIVALAAALVVSLMYIFMKKPSNSNADEAITYPTTATSLSISEWGVTGHYMGSQPLKYKIKDNVLHFTSDGIESVCGYDYSGFISRYTADQYIDSKGYGIVPSSTKNAIKASDINLAKIHTGDYYYIMTQPTAPCINEKNADRDVWVKGTHDVSMKISSAQGEVISEMQDLFLTLNKK